MVGQKVWCSLWETTTMRSSCGPPAESWRCFLSVQATSRLLLMLVSECVHYILHLTLFSPFVSLLWFFFILRPWRNILISFSFIPKYCSLGRFCIISQSPSHFVWVLCLRMSGAFCIFFPTSDEWICVTLTVIHDYYIIKYFGDCYRCFPFVCHVIIL